MTKALMGSFLRAVCAIAIGILLILYPDNTVLWLTMAIGVLFFVSGTISCLAYLNARRQLRIATQADKEAGRSTGRLPMYPIVGMGSLILGLLLALTPAVFVKGLMYILGFALVMGAINQYMSLLGASRIARVPFIYWVCPTIILLTGLLVLLKPMASAALPMLITGWCCLLYGVTEVVNALKIRSATARFAQQEQSQDSQSSQ